MRGSPVPDQVQRTQYKGPSPLAPWRLGLPICESGEWVLTVELLGAQRDRCLVWGDWNLPTSRLVPLVERNEDLPLVSRTPGRRGILQTSETALPWAIEAGGLFAGARGISERDWTIKLNNTKSFKGSQAGAGPQCHTPGP